MSLVVETARLEPVVPDPVAEDVLRYVPARDAALVSCRYDPTTPAAPWNVSIKRVLDVAGASLLLVLFAPVLVALCLLVMVQDGGSFLYRQRRIGRSGTEFWCLKVRTMTSDAQARLDTLLADCPASRREWDDTQKLRRDPRLLVGGRLVRKFSLDELPQLVNVLRGDMSLVGPRPVVRSELARYGAHLSAYLAVRPGLTGLWQVSGRSDLSYAQRVDLDARYVRQRSLAVDIRILLRTIPAVLGARGSY